MNNDIAQTETISLIKTTRCQKNAQFNHNFHQQVNVFISFHAQLAGQPVGYCMPPIFCSASLSLAWILSFCNSFYCIIFSGCGILCASDTVGYIVLDFFLQFQSKKYKIISILTINLQLFSIFSCKSRIKIIFLNSLAIYEFLQNLQNFIEGIM